MNAAQQFSKAAAAKAVDLRHRAIIQKNISSYDIGVARGKDKFADWQNARSRVAAIKWETVNHLDRYLEEFERNVLSNGGHVHWAEDAEQARQIVLTLARQHGVRKVVKAKSMTTEEIHLNPALEAAGIQPVETDLGEDRPPPRPPDEEPQRRPPPQALQVRGPAYATVLCASGEWRIMTMANKEVTLSLAMNLSGLRAETQRFLHALLVAVPLGLLLIVGGGWLIGQLALRPVERIAQTVESVTAARLDARIPEARADDEFKRLIALINGMLERLERSFRQATRFSADAAHELKTPLAILQAQVERSLQRAADDSPEQRDCAAQLEELQRLKSTLHKLLLLSQADAGHLPLSLARIDLAGMVRAAENDIALLAPGRKTRIETPGELFIQADESLLSQVIGNLVSNAVKFGDAGGVIEMALTEQTGLAVLTVSNTGIPIPKADHGKVFERFYRADASRSREIEGAGLGLSLAREMARAHGGDLTLVRSDAQRTTFALSLPK